MIGRSGGEGERKLDRVEREGKKEQKIGKGEEAVSYTHLTLPTNREV